MEFWTYLGFLEIFENFLTLQVMPFAKQIILD